LSLRHSMNTPASQLLRYIIIRLARWLSMVVLGHFLATLGVCVHRVRSLLLLLFLLLFLLLL
jgi:hypothetical protein